MEVLLQRDCLGGERIVEIRLPRGIERVDLDQLSGTQTILENLPRPFFKVDVPGEYLFSGILGEPMVRFTVRLARRDSARALALEVAAALMQRDGS